MGRKTRNDRIAVLIRRRNFLMNRVSESDKDLSFDREELAALDWAIAELKKGNHEEETCE